MCLLTLQKLLWYAIASIDIFAEYNRHLLRSAYKVTLPNPRRSGSIISTVLMRCSVYAMLETSYFFKIS